MVTSVSASSGPSARRWRSSTSLPSFRTALLSQIPEGDELAVPGQERLAGVRAEVPVAEFGRHAIVTLGLGELVEAPVG